MEQRIRRLQRAVAWASQLFLCVLLAACALPGHNPDELERVWNGASV